MTSRVRVLAAVCALSAAALRLPPPLDAQGRRAVRAGRGRSAVVVGAFYQPLFYDPWFDPYYRWYPFPYGYAGGYAPAASLRLQVTPRQTEVFVDGYFAGTVDDFDGFLQRLHLEPGEHDIQLYLPGHRTIEQKIYLQHGGTFRVKHTMEPLASGAPEPARPAATALPPPGRLGPRGRTPDGRSPEGRAPDINSDFGALAIRVQPGDADVFIDGEEWDGPRDDERLVVQVSAGVHRLEVRKDGYRTYSADVTVRRGETEVVNIAMGRP